MPKLALLIVIGLGSLLYSCGQEAPVKPTIRRASAGQQGSVNEFSRFLLDADRLDPTSEDVAEQFPSLVLKSQLRLMIANLSSSSLKAASERGKCLLFIAADRGFQDSDIESSDILISAGGRVAYTESSNFQASECQNIFRDAMRERFQQDFFQVHTSFFSFDFE